MPGVANRFGLNGRLSAVPEDSRLEWGGCRCRTGQLGAPSFKSMMTLRRLRVRSDGMNGTLNSNS